MTGLPHVTQEPAPERTRRSDAAVLVTGAGGEVGHGLVAALHGAGRRRIVALDVRELEARQRELCRTAYVGDIRDRALLREIVTRHEIDEVYHLAAVLSTKAEREPVLAHEVNVDGTANMLLLAAERAGRTGRPVTFVFPSSIAVYGLPDLDAKRRAGRVRENEHLAPRTIYGCHKLFAEHLGRNLARRGVDFRALRFPGLISAHTLPSGGTSDFAPEMVHAAARHEHYRCFVRPDTRIPFMAMPDAIEATLRLAAADA
jgi:nucleoside-diphosphate-sugar epimerase